jgi:hypothetical protein
VVTCTSIGPRPPVLGCVVFSPVPCYRLPGARCNIYKVSYHYVWLPCLPCAVSDAISFRLLEIELCIIMGGVLDGAQR